MRTSVIAIAALALGLGLAGCGSDSKTASTTSSATSTTSASATPQAHAHKSIADYIKENGITEAQVKRGDPGSPTIDLPFPPGWAPSDPAQTPQWAYGAIVATDPQFAPNPPSIIALVSKLTGNVDPAKILEFAPGEIQNLPGYQGANNGQPSKLAGFDAVQIGGTYNKNGVQRAIAQKTVVIPGKDGLYVLQLNADGTQEQLPALMDATKVIDDQTKITP
jgi:hypothetical protein